MDRYNFDIKKLAEELLAQSRDGQRDVMVELTDDAITIVYYYFHLIEERLAVELGLRTEKILGRDCFLMLAGKMLYLITRGSLLESEFSLPLPLDPYSPTAPVLVALTDINKIQG